MDFSERVRVLLDAVFSLPNGDPLVHVSPGILPASATGLVDGWYSSWLFPPQSHLVRTLDPYVHYSFDAGLRHEWMRRAR